MSKTIIAVRHFGLGGRESLETAVIFCKKNPHHLHFMCTKLLRKNLKLRSRSERVPYVPNAFQNAFQSVPDETWKRVPLFGEISRSHIWRSRHRMKPELLQCLKIRTILYQLKDIYATFEIEVYLSLYTEPYKIQPV